MHACAGNPVPLGKVPGQVPPAFSFVCGALGRGEQQFPVLSTDGGRASNEPEASDPELGLRQSAPSNEPEAVLKILPKTKILPKIDSDSSDSSQPPVGRWRRSIPKSWKSKAVPQVDLEYSYDATSDVHTFNPNHDGVIEAVAAL